MVVIYWNESSSHKIITDFIKIRVLLNILGAHSDEDVRVFIPECDMKESFFQYTVQVYCYHGLARLNGLRFDFNQYFWNWTALPKCVNMWNPWMLLAILQILI